MDRPFDRHLPRFAKFAAVTALAVSAAVLLGWLFDIAAIKRVVTGLNTMKPNTALGIAAVGAALGLRAEAGKHRGAGRALAAFAALLGALNLFEYQSGIDLGIDERLFRDTEADLFPGRMAPMTALSLLLFGAALLLLDTHGGEYLTQPFALVIAAANVLVSVGYPFGPDPLYQLGNYTSVAAHTAFSFVLLALGVLAARPGRGVMGLLTDPSLGGFVVRRQLAAALAFLFAVGWARIAGERAGLFGAPFGTALMVALCVTGFALLIGATGHRLRDIDLRRKSSEEAVEQQRRLLHATLVGIGDAVIATDTGGRVTFLNPVAEALTGWPNAAGVGLPLGDVFQIVDGESRQPAGNPALRALREGVTVALANSTVLIDRAGVERPIEDSAAPIRDGAGETVGAVLVFRDITRRHRLEGELRGLAADRAAADRRKDEFLATLAHELRNPLAPIRNGLQIIRLSGAGGAVGRAREMMERQLAQMVRLVDDLLDVSRITRGKLELRRARFDLREAVDAAVEASLPGIEQAGHELAVDLPEGPVFVEGDAARLAQVLSNLLNNAAKYMRAGGRIRLAVASAEDRVELSVADEGIGISAADLPSVFELFKQVDGTLEKSAGGLGIGLSLVKALVEMHGGTVEASSRGQGQGSEFVIRLPAAPAGPEAAAAQRGQEGERKVTSALRVLVVDDNVDAAESLALLLGLEGHEVRTAHDGEAGAAAAASFRPDAVFMDIGMPKLNGYDAARRIRSMPEGQAMLLVAVTGWGQEDDRAKSAAAGFDEHLVKPVEMKVLRALLGRARRLIA